MNQKYQNLIDIAETLLTTGRKITTGANVHDLYNTMNRVVNNVTTLKTYIELNNIEKQEYMYNKLLNSTNDLREDLKVFI